MHTAIALQLPDEAHRLIDEAADAAGWLRGTHHGDQLRVAAHRSMDVVLTRCQSSIERAFYGSLLLRSISEEGLLVAVDCAIATDLLRFRHRVRRLHELREEYAIERGHGFHDFVGFIDWLEEADVEFLVAYQQLGLQELPHLALHVERSGGTRMDGLVFHPLDDDEEAVVPCGRLSDVDAVLEKIKNPPL